MTVIEAPVNHVTNAVKKTINSWPLSYRKHKQWFRQCSWNMLQSFRTRIKIMKAGGTTVDTKIIAAKEDAVRNAEVIGEAAVEAVSTGI